MNKCSTTLMIAAFICGGISAQETEISRRYVPPAVLGAFEKAYPSAKVLEWEKEIHNGKLYYEAETVDGKAQRNVLYSPEGDIAQVEEKIAAHEIPAPVAEGVKREYPNASVGSASKVTNSGNVEYALELKGSKQKKVVMRSDGTIASSEGKKAIDRNN